jgi:SAM-dependent methyltransferase
MWARMQSRFDGQAGPFGVDGIDTLDPRHGESVVDIGCGTGTSTFQLAERVGPDGAVTGSDISPTMIEAARARLADTTLANVTFDIADAQTTTFDGSADAVFSRFGVMFFADPIDAFRNILGALRPGGRMVFVCWQSPMVNPWLSGAMATIREHIDLPLGRDPHAPGPFAFADADRVIGILANAGFADARATAIERMVPVGSDLADATDYVFQLTPPLRALDEDDPARAATIREAVAETYRPHQTGSGSVEAPGAVWAISATKPR